MTEQQTNREAREARYPLDNLTFDLIAIIYEKSKALEAYDTYLVDARGDQYVGELLERMRQQDEDCIIEIQQHLGRLITQNPKIQKQVNRA